ncbi:hypothetical protein E3C22_05955 [Jiella endophytica]|uniref:Uncharacterized protein n=1 Tax=Jiella endophytica TaxID=2558362 RepID=A0A4Y8RMW1_9HYPH|nr:hypothetical protein [Jiella endophytica]TFF24928.1 hypothetical protein E3C22_05955 [Jiella endophytica]
MASLYRKTFAAGSPFGDALHEEAGHFSFEQSSVLAKSLLLTREIELAFLGRESLRAQYHAAVAAAEDLDEPKDRARHIALVEVITENRADFPPDEFVVHTGLEAGGAISTRIAPLAPAKRHRSQALAGSPLAPSPRPADLESDSNPVAMRALSRIVETLVLAADASEDGPRGGEPVFEEPLDPELAANDA